MSLIIIEGPDSTGKSTLAAELQRSMALDGVSVECSHPGPPPSSFEASVLLSSRAITKAADTERVFITDRVTAVSEIIYGPLRQSFIERGGLTRDIPALFSALVNLIENDAKFIYCKRSGCAFDSTKHVASANDTAETLNALEQHADSIDQAYDALFRIISHIGGDVTQYSYSENFDKQLNLEI